MDEVLLLAKGYRGRRKTKEGSPQRFDIISLTSICRTDSQPGAAAEQEEEIRWDDDDDEDQSPTPNIAAGAANHSNDSTTTLTSNKLLKPKEPRRSCEDNKSVAGSDASYDIVSSAASRAANSPKDEKRDSKDESDDDWE